MSQMTNNTLAQPIKMQKAMKHTMPRLNQNSEYNQQTTSSSQLTIINDIAPSASPSTLIHINNTSNNNSNSSITIGESSNQFFANNLDTTSSTTVASTSGKFQKAVKHTSNIFSRETTSSSSSQSPATSHKVSSGSNKAVKHTGGGSNSYYQNKSSLNINNNRYNMTVANQESLKSMPINNNRTPVLTSLVTGVSATSPQTNANPTSTTNNKITITTTYVYKRVLTQPEIDLNLECEEEEIVYIVESPKPPSPQPESMDAIEEVKNEEISSDPAPVVAPVVSTVHDAVVDAVQESKLNDEKIKCPPVLETIPSETINNSQVPVGTSILLDETKLENEKPIEKPEIKEKEMPTSIDQVIRPATDKENEPIIESEQLTNEDEILVSKLIPSSNENKNLDVLNKIGDKKRTSKSLSSLQAVSEKKNLDATGKSIFVFENICQFNLKLFLNVHLTIFRIILKRATC